MPCIATADAGPETKTLAASRMQPDSPCQAFADKAFTGTKNYRSIDLCTKLGCIAKAPAKITGFITIRFNILFLKHFILSKYCTITTKTLINHYLPFPLLSYSQSYPQNVWVRQFLFESNELRVVMNGLSSSFKQLSDVV